MSSFTNRVDTLFSQWDTTASPGCVLAVIKDGEFIYKRGYGMADLERGMPITAESIFDIGSTGKQFTATVIAILAKQGILALDDPISKYLPEMPAYANKITIRHLIHHTSGIRDYLTLMNLRGMLVENIYAEDLLLDLITRQKGLNFKPGNEYLYSNSGYFLLGAIAQRVTGKHITEIIKEHILAPLGMKHTTFNKDYRPIVKHRAMSYDLGEEDGTFINAVALSGGFGDGALLTNIEDLLLWDCNFYNNKLNNAQADLLDQLHNTGRLNNGKPINYAFGLVVDSYNGQKIVQHGGSWAGYRTEMMRFPDQRFTVICISNLGSVNPISLCQQVADMYFEDIFTARKERKSLHAQTTSSPKTLSGSEMESFTGIYQGKQSTLDIFVKDDKLFFSNGARNYQIHLLGKKKFQLEQRPVFLSFLGKQNEQIAIDKIVGHIIKLKRVQTKRYIPQSLSIYTGEYYSPELDIRYTITTQDNTLQLKRTPFDKLNPVYPFTEIAFLCDVGEMRLRYKDGMVKGFTLNAERVANIKFRKVV